MKDGLTGVFNRHYFDIHIKQITQKANDSKGPLCMLMCDIDDFKLVNDTYGHQAGDIIIKTIASTLKDMLRVTDLVARYGGEEFTVFLNNATIDQAVSIAESIRKQVESISFEIETNEEPIKKTISIGVTSYKTGESINDFIERADKALYRAKETGKNKVVEMI